MEEVGASIASISSDLLSKVGGQCQTIRQHGTKMQADCLKAIPQAPRRTRAMLACQYIIACGPGRNNLSGTALRFTTLIYTALIHSTSISIPEHAQSQR